MTTRDALQAAMAHGSVDDAMGELIEREVWLADVGVFVRTIPAIASGRLLEELAAGCSVRDVARRWGVDPRVVRVETGRLAAYFLRR